MIINYVTKDECDHLLNKNSLVKELAYINIHSFAGGFDTFEKYTHPSFGKIAWHIDTVHRNCTITRTNQSVVDRCSTKLFKHLWARRSQVTNNNLVYHDLWFFSNIGHLVASTEFLEDFEKRGSAHVLIIAPYPLIELLLGYYAASKNVRDFKDSLQITVLPLALKEGERHEDCIKLLKQILTAKHHHLIKTEPANRNTN